MQSLKRRLDKLTIKPGDVPEIVIYQAGDQDGAIALMRDSLQESKVVVYLPDNHRDASPNSINI